MDKSVLLVGPAKREESRILAARLLILLCLAAAVANALQLRPDASFSAAQAERLIRALNLLPKEAGSASAGDGAPSVAPGELLERRRLRPPATSTLEAGGAPSGRFDGVVSLAEEELHADYLPWFHSFELLSFCRSQEISRAWTLIVVAWAFLLLWIGDSLSALCSMLFLILTFSNIIQMDLVCGGTSAFCYQ
ncbi:hypothetical protein EJB05_51494, partial [Eragrostis curvula]